jgi:hypothetical protein
MMWMKFLMDLGEDEMLFGAFQNATERAQELINPMMLAASKVTIIDIAEGYNVVCIDRCPLEILWTAINTISIVSFRLWRG